MNARWLAGKIGASLLTLVFVLVFNFFLFRGIGDPTTSWPGCRSRRRRRSRTCARSTGSTSRCRASSQITSATP